MIKTLKRILALAGKYKGDIYTGIGCSLLESLFASADLFALLYLTVHLAEITPPVIGKALLILGLV